MLALLALVDIEPVTRTRNLRYNQIIKSALALNGIDLSITDDEETGAGAESDKNKGEVKTDADKLEKLLLKFGQEFLGGLIRKDFKVSIAAARISILNAASIGQPVRAQYWFTGGTTRPNRN